MQKYLGAIALIASALTASGCSSLATYTSKFGISGGTAQASDAGAAQQRIDELESALAAKDRDLAAAQARLDANPDVRAVDTADAGLFPPNPKPGECYARVLIPASFETVSEQVLTSEASERIEIIPAQYETVEETVVVKEASTRIEVVPAVYEEVQEQVLVKPASREIVEIPAVYETVTERVIDKPAHTAWKKGPAAIQTANVLSETTTDTGEIMCLVEVPATYKTIEKRVLVTPARTREVEVPAEYETVTRTVLKSPATTREIRIPAEYETVEVTRIVSPASEKRLRVPAEYRTVTTRQRTSDERMEWRQVMCEVNMTRDNVMALQRALADKGYYKASIDGIFGAQTLGAARQFARDNNLPEGSNYVPMEVVENLEISL